MAESADDPALYWIEPEKRGIIPLDRFHVPGRLARTVRSDRFAVAVDRDFDARDRRLRRSQPGTSADLDQQPNPQPLSKALRTRRLPHRRGLRGRRAGRRPLRRQPRTRVLRREHVPPRARRFKGRAGASGGTAEGRGISACSIRSSSPTICERSARLEVARPAYHKLLDAALVGEGDFAALPLDSPVSGEDACWQPWALVTAAPGAGPGLTGSRGSRSTAGAWRAAGRCGRAGADGSAGERAPARVVVPPAMSALALSNR